jgi:hypothetical protein
LQHTDHPLPGWDVTCAVCRLTPAEAFRLGYRAAVAAYRAQDGGAEEAVRRVDRSAVSIAQAAWDDGYQACYEGTQRCRNPYRAALAPQAGDGAW